MILIGALAFDYAWYLAYCGIRRMNRSLNAERMLRTDGRAMFVKEPRFADGYHVFLSYDSSDWAQAQYIKSALNVLVPSIEIFLHREDLQDASQIEKHVEESDVRHTPHFASRSCLSSHRRCDVPHHRTSNCTGRLARAELCRCAVPPCHSRVVPLPSPALTSCAAAQSQRFWIAPPCRHRSSSR
jgi:hypothetical protein